MRGTYERGRPTQPGNPHELTINQHVLPKASIERFAGADGAVDFCWVSTAKLTRLRAGNAAFCADRVWDHRAEAGPTTKRVEVEFKKLVDRIASGQATALAAPTSPRF